MSKRCLGCMELFGDEFEICPHCGYVVGTHAEEAIHMEPGTLLYDRYIVGKVLGYGGFGVTYLGWDGKLEQKVAIKEYLPGEFSTRMPGQSQVTVFNGEKNEQFHDGLRKFVEEAKHLAKFQNEQGIVKIFDSFEENDTAYIIMEYLDGETLTEYLRREKTIPEDVAVAMLTPVMESLQAVHDEGLLHRDIAPDNIFLTKSGEVKLIDFGASRYATTSHSRSLTVIIKPGYSPEEQYRSRGDQGPHTDVYAIAATLYKMITGKTPPDAMERRAKYENQNKDILEEPHKINKKISPNRENAILNAMNVRIEDRTPDIATFIRDLNADPPVKRVYGKIKKIDVYSWPKWLKIFIPSLLALILTFGILMVTGVIKFSNFTENIVIPENVVVVPDVEGLYKDEALKLIQDGKLIASTDGSIESEYIPAGKIILQTPPGGSYMNINGTVVLMISSGKGVASPENGVSVVPYVIWDAKEDAVAKLLQAGLAEPEIIEKHDENVAYGSVIAQSVEAGTQVEEGTRITLTISLGAAAFDIPNVVGQSKENAESTLNGKGLVVKIEYKKTDDVAEGNVISQSVAAGSSVKRGDEVTLTISSGRETVDVADVVGMTTDNAKKTLEDQGFTVTVLENYDSNVAAGRVISQDPAAGTAQLPGSDITIYVSKGKKPITITFDANGGSVSTTSKSAYVSDPYGTLPTPNRVGYEFIGWYSAATDGVKVTSSTGITAPTSHTLYARWKANTYTLSFNSNGGGSAPVSKSVTYGSKYGTLGTVTRTGYTFDGWYTATSGGTKITEAAVYSTAGNQTIYAHWTANTYTVTFDANGGTGSMYAQTFTYDVSQRLTENTITRAGYVFLGWSTSSSSTTVKYTDRQSVSNLTSSSNGNVTLYAVWQLETVSLNMTSTTLTRTPTGITLSSSSMTLATTATSSYNSSGVLSASISGYSSPTVTLNASVSSGASVTWSSSNTAVATVSSSGVVTAKSTGTATITATTSMGNKATCTVTIVNGNSSITWSTSNSSVANVSSGSVSAVGKGTATITASVNGNSASCRVTVGRTYRAIGLTGSSAYATFKYNNASRGLFFYNSNNATSFTFTFVTGSSAPSSGCLYQVYNSSNKIGGQIYFSSGKIAVTQYYGSSTSTQTSSYTLLANTKYTVVVNFAKGAASGTIVIKDENGNVINTTSCSWSCKGADGTSSAAIGPNSSIKNGTAPNIYLMSINFSGTNGIEGYGNLINCSMDFSSGSIGTTSFTSGKCSANFSGTSVQYYVQF